MEKMLKFGPKSMKGKIWDEGGNSQIVQIILSYSDTIIKSIQFIYVQNGSVCRSQVHGEPSGPKYSTVTFDYPSEFLISVSGMNRMEVFGGGDSELASIAFGTNKRNYGPFGRSAEFRYNFEMKNHPKFSYEFGPSRSFAGFHGSACSGIDGCVNAIGVYVKPIESLSQLNIKNI